MNIEEIQAFCKSLPFVTEDVKWGHDLVFSIGEKMFCVVGLSETPTSATFKVKDEEFDEMSTRSGFKPAPYVARYKWVMIEDTDTISRGDLEHYLKQSYELVKSKLPAKIRKQLELSGESH